MFQRFEDCTVCPRECHVNRNTGSPGYCKSKAGYNIASICLHTGEEPVISGEKGLCNIFFSHCNLQCVYCQNYQISCNNYNPIKDEMILEDVVSQVCKILDAGENILGFVSPSHCIPQMEAIIESLHSVGRTPVIVYNSNAYDRVETLRNLEGLVDVYLPDFKYSDANLGLKLSDVGDYPEIATAAIKEMVRQKGTSLRLADNGLVESGIVVRHLVLPGFVENSINALKILSEEISPLLNISLMSQYYPAVRVEGFPKLNRRISSGEYRQVVEAMGAYGFHRGWLQDEESSECYKPDFLRDHPFEK